MTKLTMLHFATSANRLYTAEKKRQDQSKSNKEAMHAISLYLAVIKTVQRCCPPGMVKRKLITNGMCDRACENRPCEHKKIADF